MSHEKAVHGLPGWAVLFVSIAVLFGASYALVQAAREASSWEIVLWSLVAVPFAIYMAVASGRTWVLLAIAGAPVAMLLRRRPYLAGAALIVAATILRLSWIGAASSDSIDVSQLAAGRAFGSGSLRRIRI